MSVIRVGSTTQYADGWEQIFGGPGGKAGTRKKAAKQARPKGKATKAARKKAAAPKAAKKKAKSRKS